MSSIETDTIVALATPPGRSGIGIVRLSGPQSLGILRDANVPLLTHAELQKPIDDNGAHLRALEAAGLDHRSYRWHLASRPNAAEDAAVALKLRRVMSTTGMIAGGSVGSASMMAFNRDRLACTLR